MSSIFCKLSPSYKKIGVYVRNTQKFMNSDILVCSKNSGDKIYVSLKNSRYDKIDFENIIKNNKQINIKAKSTINPKFYYLDDVTSFTSSDVFLL